MTEFNQAAEALDRFSDGQGSDAAQATAEAFEDAGERIARALEKAAKSGEVSFNSLAESVAQSLARMAVQDLIIDPLTEALSGLGGGGSVSPVNVNMTVNGVSDAQSFTRSSGQISAGLTRLVAGGRRYL